MDMRHLRLGVLPDIVVVCDAKGAVCLGKLQIRASRHSKMHQGQTASCEARCGLFLVHREARICILHRRLAAFAKCCFMNEARCI